MSGILQRYRGISSQEYWRNADEMRILLTKALMRESIVPLRWRYVFTFPIIGLLRTLMADIEEADRQARCSKERLALQDKCKRDCEDILRELQYLISVLKADSIKKGIPLEYGILKSAEMLEREIELIELWKDRV